MDLPPIVQVLLGTGFTYGMTVLGAGTVFITKNVSKKLMDFFYGFTAGVMISTSCFGLIEPAMTESSNQKWSQHVPWVPVSVGFILGAGFLKSVEMYFSGAHGHGHGHGSEYTTSNSEHNSSLAPEQVIIVENINNDNPSEVLVHNDNNNNQATKNVHVKNRNCFDRITSLMWGNEKTDTVKLRRTMLLVIAITLHNFPEGVAVGVAFGNILYAEDKEKAFHNALGLAFAVGIQNIPEGIGVSMPLRREGMSQSRAFLLGQASGLVEPIGGIIGVLAVSLVRPLLPIALSFAAGAMLFVVMEELIPESQNGHKNWATFGTLLGFLIMTILESSLG